MKIIYILLCTYIATLNLPAQVLMTLILVASAALVLISRQNLRYCIAIWVGLLLGYGLIHYWQGQVLPKELEGQKLKLTATVAQVSHAFGNRVKLQLIPGQWLNSEWQTRGRLSVYWYGSRNINLPANLAEGMTCHLTVKLKRPHGLSNFNETTSQEKRFFAEHIVASGYVVQNPHNHCSGKQPFRDQLIASLRQQYSDLAEINTIIALALGDKEYLRKDIRDVYQQTGTQHLLVVSGLHVALVAGFILKLCSYLWRRSYRLCLYYPEPVVTTSVALLAAFLFAKLTGFGLPAQRAAIMLSVFSLPKLGLLKVNAATSLLLAFIVISLLEPFAAMTISFWLSFSVVGLIFYLLQQPKQTFLKITCSISLLMGIFSSYFFSTVSVVSPLANFVAVPFTSFVILPLSLLGIVLFYVSPTVGGFLITIVDSCLELQRAYLAWLANLPGATHSFHFVSFTSASLALLLLLILFLPGILPGRFMILLSLLLLLLFDNKKPGKEELWVQVFDVGQGLSVLIETQSHSVLYDTGPGFKGVSPINQSLIPYLIANKVSMLDALVISHFDNDHAGGARDVLQRVSAKTVYAPFKDATFRSQPCQNTTTFQYDGATFSFLYPTVKEAIFSLSKNNRSCVLKVTFGKVTILLPGDIEKYAEKKLLEYNRFDNPIDILVAPHHGSKTSSSYEFIETLRPSHVVFSAGYRNRYGIPHQEVKRRYESINSIAYNTAKTGAILFKIRDNGEIRVSLARQQKYLWQLPDKII